MVRSTDRPAITIAVDLGRKATKQTNKQTKTTTGSLLSLKRLCPPWNTGISLFEIVQTSSYRNALCISLVLVLDSVKI